MATNFYADMASVAKGVLKEFKQGTLELSIETETAGDSSFEPGPSTTQLLTLDGVIKGVSSKYVDGTEIIVSDLQASVATTAIDQATGAIVAFEPSPKHSLLVDGVSKPIKVVKKVPSAGTPVLYLIFVAG